MPDSTAWSLDHVFVTVAPGAHSMDLIAGAGFVEGARNRHRGQGTSCRRVFFDDAYLELLWRDGAVSADVTGLERTTIPARVSMREGVSRFGVVVRGHFPGMPPPVAARPYRPPYLPDGVTLHIADNAPVLEEPLLVFLPPGASRPPAPEHPTGASDVTSVSLTVTGERPLSDALRWAGGLERLTVERGDRERMEVELDHGRRGARLSLEPTAPLVLNW